MKSCKKRKPYKNGWTPAEDQKLKKLVGEGIMMPVLATFFPNRTATAVAKRRADIGARKKESVWFSRQNPACVAEVIKFKMAGYRHVDIARIYKVSVASVSQLLCKVGLKQFRVQKKMPETKDRWTEVEIAQLRKLCKRIHRRGFTRRDWEYIASQFPGRTRRAVMKKAGRIMKYWRTPEEIAKEEALAAKQLKVDWNAPRSSASTVYWRENITPAPVQVCTPAEYQTLKYHERNHA